MTADLKDIVKKVVEGPAGEKKEAEEAIQLVVFELDGEEYCVGILDVQEIIKIPDITPVPNAPEFIRGICNLRGKVVVAVDLEKRFRLVRERPAAPKNAVIADVGGTLFGIIVDQVSEVIRIPVSRIQPPPALVSSKIHAEYVKGVIVEDGGAGRSRLLILLDLRKLLKDSELLGFGQEVRKASES